MFNLLSFSMWLKVNIFLWQQLPYVLLHFVYLRFDWRNAEALSLPKCSDFFIGATNEATVFFPLSLLPGGSS